MNTKKILALAITALLSASLLCGCNGETRDPDSKTGSDSGTSPESISDTVSDTSSAGTESGSGTTSEPGALSFLMGLADDPILLSEISSIETDKDEQITAAELTQENFRAATVDCSYYALPLYPCVTDKESEFDEENIVFKNVPRDAKEDYIKVKKGDKIFDFTVSEASSVFTSTSPLAGKLMRTSLALDGEITLTGYARMVAENEYGVSIGSILFVPVGEVKLPVVRFDEFDGVNASRSIGEVWSNSDLYFTNEFTDEFKLGNKNETTEDITALSTDGSSVKVELTLYDIEVTTSLLSVPHLTAKFKNMTAV